MTDWIDISVPLRTGMVHWPDNPPVRIERISAIEHGDDANVSVMSMGTHTGTHMDAPSHFLPEGAGIDQAPPDALIGPARVIGIADEPCVRAQTLAAHALTRGERILLRTPNSDRAWATDRFIEDFIYVSREAAQLVADAGVRLLGIDYLSVGGFERDAVETHRALLEAGVWIVEGLNLSAVPPGRYELICLPLRIAGGDGAPARAVVRPLVI